jgi:uncharacterized protein
LSSMNTVSSYIGYMENSWLVYTVNLYDFSVKKLQIAPKKVYCIATGLVNSVGFNYSPYTGKLRKNLVFLALRRQTRDIYYYLMPGGYAVDFYLPDRHEMIQVLQHLENPAVREWEMRSLEEAFENITVQIIPTCVGYLRLIKCVRFAGVISAFG